MARNLTAIKARCHAYQCRMRGREFHPLPAEGSSTTHRDYALCRLFTIITASMMTRPTTVRSIAPNSGIGVP